MRTYRTAVVGTGFIGPVHVEGLRRAGVEVVSIIGSSPEKSRQACREMGIRPGHSTLEEVLADPQIEVVHLATPNRLHFAQAKEALMAGKHVVCEKPLAMDSAESEALVRMAAESGKVAAVAYNIRFYPLCHEAAARVRGGEAGEFLHVTGSYTQDWLLHATDFNWRVSAREGGPLRAIADIGTHWMDLIQFITGTKIASVLADLKTVHPTRYIPRGETTTFSNHRPELDQCIPVTIDTEDCGSVLLRFENGAKGCMWVSQTMAGRKNCLQWELGGTEASLAWNSERPNQLELGYRDRPNALLIRDPSLMHPTARAISQYPGGHNEGFPDTFKQLFRKVYQAIERAEADPLAASADRLEAEQIPTFRDGHREILLCEAILASHRESRWVQVGVPSV